MSRWRNLHQSSLHVFFFGGETLWCVQQAQQFRRVENSEGRCLMGNDHPPSIKQQRWSQAGEFDHIPMICFRYHDCTIIIISFHLPMNDMFQISFEFSPSAAAPLCQLLWCAYMTSQLTVFLTTRTTHAIQGVPAIELHAAPTSNRTIFWKFPPTTTHHEKRRRKHYKNKKTHNQDETTMNHLKNTHHGSSNNTVQHQTITNWTTHTRTIRVSTQK